MTTQPKHQWEPSDNQGHNMDCLNCGESISFQDNERWNTELDAECSPKRPFEIRDGQGKTFNTVTNPAVVFDKSTGTLLKIGEFSDMENYFTVSQAAYRNAGFIDMADDVTLMDLPRDQNVIDKVFQNTGYLLTLYKKLNLN